MKNQVRLLVGDQSRRLVLFRQFVLFVSYKALLGGPFGLKLKAWVLVAFTVFCFSIVVSSCWLVLTPTALGLTVFLCILGCS